MKKKQKIKGKQNKWADHLTHRAKTDNYPARSVYKLMEIQSRFQIIKKGDRVLDLGCAPGSWLMLAAKTAGHGGSVLGIDLKKVDTKLPANSQAFQGDIFDMGEALAAAVGNGYDVILSDMAPATTGRKEIDAFRSFELSKAALEKACELLNPGGNFVCKIFQGSDFKVFEKSVKSSFNSHKIFKPESCRKSSKEIYIIGIQKKNSIQKINFHQTQKIQANIP